MPPSHQVDYPLEYIDACFVAWYRAGAPSLNISDEDVTVGSRRVMQSIPPIDGRKPNIVTVGRWAVKYGWRERADILDAQVSIKLEKEVVEERVKILRKLAKAGESLLDKGLDYIEKNSTPFADNPSAAVRAVVAGAQMIAQYAGAADRLSAIGGMSDKQLEREILNLLGTEKHEDENTVDVIAEDVLSEDDDTTADDND
jgi:hypothetical protein